MCFVISNSQDGGLCNVKLNRTELDNPNLYTMVTLRQCHQLGHVNTADTVEMTMLKDLLGREDVGLLDNLVGEP